MVDDSKMSRGDEAQYGRFYRNHALLRAVIDAVLENRCGRVLCPGPGARAVMLDFGCYRIPGGDAAAPEARRLLARLTGPCEIVVPDDDAWRGLLAEVWGARARDRSMQSFAPGPDLKERTAVAAGEVPPGYVLQRLDAATAALAGPEVSPNGVGVMGGPARFVERGFGWALLRGGALACAATSYAVSSRYVEVAIATHPAHRRRALAGCAAAALIREALERGLEPHWNAFNPVSQHLARRLGFAYVGTCEIQALDDAADSPQSAG